MKNFTLFDTTTTPSASLYDRLAFLSRLPHPIYAHGISWLAEYISTAFFLFLALSSEQIAFSTAYFDLVGGEAATLLYACLGYAFAFVVSAWIFFRITSGLFNPAITLGMCVIGTLHWSRALVVILAQFLGAMTAAGLVDAIFPGPLVPSMALGGDSSTARGFFIELFLTMCFVTMVFVMAGEKHKGSHFIAPIGLGLALFSVELSSILYTGGSLNPARAFAVAVASHAWPSYHWIYWLAPFLGCIPAGFFYNLIKLLEYEIADAGQRHVAKSVHHQHNQEVIPEAISGHKLSVVPEHDVEKGNVVGIAK